MAGESHATTGEHPMKRFAYDDFAVWVGVHSQMGILVYDPEAQVDVPPDKVRLYVRDEERMATFSKERARTFLAEGSGEEDTSNQIADAANSYVSLRTLMGLLIIAPATLLPSGRGQSTSAPGQSVSG